MDKSKLPAATTAPPRDQRFKHPYDPDDRDLVAAEVVYTKGVRYHGKAYRPGETLTLTRGDALAANTPDRKVFRILATARYYKGPADQAEEQPKPGPLELD